VAVATGLQHPAFVEDHDVATQHQGFGGFGGGVHHDRGPFPENFLKLHPKFFPKFVVEVDQGFVQQQQLGVLHQGTGDGSSLLLSAGQLCGHTVQHAFQMERFSRFADPPVDLLFRQTADFQGRGDVVVDGQGGVVDELLVDHGDASFSHGNAGHVLAVKDDFPAGGPVKSGHDAQQRGFSGKGSAQQYIAGPRFKTRSICRRCVSPSTVLMTFSSFKPIAWTPICRCGEQWFGYEKEDHDGY
jgi:hypothetical protein